MIDGQFILHANNYDMEEGERSCWDQELAENGGVTLVEQKPKKQPAKPTKQKQQAKKKPAALRAISAGERARVRSAQELIASYENDAMSSAAVALAEGAVISRTRSATCASTSEGCRRRRLARGSNCFRRRADRGLQARGARCSC